MDALTLGHLAAFNVALFFAVAAPGPAFVLCVQASLNGGRRQGILTGVGLAVMAGLWTLGALWGLETVFTLVPLAYTILKIGGAVLVLAFAIQIWRGANQPVAEPVPVSTRRAVLTGFLLNLGNPKSILFSAGVLLVIFPPGLSGVEMAVVTVNHILLEILVYAALASLLAREDVRSRYLAMKPFLSRAMALVLGGLGLRLLVTS
ncbi:threonine transporter [Jannaschia pagri]|uniref:Threonine transporter n=1 Tax=Jannaschia pagri TaxID=2829797 RepID=A0ABQ4NN42_9RHOB|nr:MULTISPECIES: LysE family translocator [unclassified Jannaschia]GIT91959.1 threonine transporter [Jannaschia sp. AI_61]GIT95793.1 threonine transporter [Jannaschia sp. AI_62]